MENTTGRYEANVLKSKENPDESFGLWNLRVEAALGGSGLTHKSNDIEVAGRFDKRAKQIIIAALDNSSLREIPDLISTTKVE